MSDPAKQETVNDAEKDSMIDEHLNDGENEETFSTFCSLMNDDEINEEQFMQILNIQPDVQPEARSKIEPKTNFSEPPIQSSHEISSSTQAQTAKAFEVINEPVPSTSTAAIHAIAHKENVDRQKPKVERAPKRTGDLSRNVKTRESSTSNEGASQLPLKKKRGRPMKVQTPEKPDTTNLSPEEAKIVVKRKRSASASLRHRRKKALEKAKRETEDETIEERHKLLITKSNKLTDLIKKLKTLCRIPSNISFDNLRFGFEIELQKIREN